MTGFQVGKKKDDQKKQDPEYQPEIFKGKLHLKKRNRKDTK